MRTSAKEKRIREEVPIALERMGFRPNGESDTWSKDDLLIRLKIEQKANQPAKQYLIEVIQGGQIVRKLNAGRLWQPSLKRLLLLTGRARRRELRQARQSGTPLKNIKNDELRNCDISPMKKSEFTTSGCVRCGGLGIATKWLRGAGPVCPECFDLFVAQGLRG